MKRTIKLGINPVAKGQKKEAMCRNLHEADGWTTVFKSQRIRFGKIDFADGVADLVFVRGKERKYVNVKNHDGFHSHPQVQKMMKEFKEQHGFEHELFELWIWKKGRWTGRKPNKVWEKPEWVTIQI